jgi:hypothetical protein
MGYEMNTIAKAHLSQLWQTLGLGLNDGEEPFDVNIPTRRDIHMRYTLLKILRLETYHFSLSHA